MMLIGVGSVMTITLVRPDADNTAVIATILSFLAPTTLSLLAFMKSQETHLSVNSRLDAFVENAKLASFASGKDEGRRAANVRTDELTSQVSGRLSVASSPVAEPEPTSVKIEDVSSAVADKLKAAITKK